MIPTASLKPAQPRARRTSTEKRKGPAPGSVPIRGTPAERFAALTRRDPTTQCLIFTGHIAENGRGRFNIDGRGVKQVYAHRFAYEQAFGRVPNGHHVVQTCDNLACCEATHLTAIPYTQPRQLVQP